jgi:hypothetical protein
MLRLIWPGKLVFDRQFARQFALYAGAVYSLKGRLLRLRASFFPTKTTTNVNKGVLTHDPQIGLRHRFRFSSKEYAPPVAETPTEMPPIQV